MILTKKEKNYQPKKLNMHPKIIDYTTQNIASLNFINLFKQFSIDS